MKIIEKPLKLENDKVNGYRDSILELIDLMIVEQCKEDKYFAALEMLKEMIMVYNEDENVIEDTELYSEILFRYLKDNSEDDEDKVMVTNIIKEQLKSELER